MAITYDVPSDTITVTAGTVGVPNSFTDIYNADVAGGWGRWTKTNNIHVCSANLNVGDGTTATHLYDEFMKVTINKPWAVKNNATLKTGVLLAAESNHPRHGCFLVLNTTAATAINVESGGTFYRYQTPVEDTGGGVNAIVGDTEEFYRGVQIVDIIGGNVDNSVGLGLAEDRDVSRVMESVLPYNMMTFVIRKNVVTGLLETCIIFGGAMAGPYTKWEPGIGHICKSAAAVCLIVDNIVDGEYYKMVWAPISVKHRFDVPTGGTCGGLTRTPRTLYIKPDK